MKCLLSLWSLCLVLTACQNNPAPSRSQSTSITPKQASIGQNPYAPVDVSPIDIAYFPADYPKRSGAEKESEPSARIIYSRPHLQGRHIFHELVPASQPWRLGANEASELELFQPATIQGRRIDAGRYTLYAIPETKQWTIVFNKQVYNWGLDIDPKQDVARFILPVEKPEAQLEYFTMIFLGKEKEATLLIGWDNSLVKLPLRFDR